MYITPTRLEVVDFSDPIYTYGDGLFVAAKDTKDYKGYEDLKGEIVGAQIGTAYVKPMQDAGVFKEVKVYDSIPDIIRDVNLGRIKAGFADFPIVVRKGDKANLEKINASLKKFKADGTIDKILAKWNLK